MSKQYPGGFITKNFTVPTTSSAPGMWTLDQALYYTQQGIWPIPTPIDQYFNYVSLLLHGNGSASGTSNVLPFNSDASTNNFNLTINGDARPNNFTPYQGNGYYSNLFNGSTDYLTVPLAAYDFGTGAFTCEAWVYIRSVASTNLIFYGSVSGGALDELAVSVNTSQQLGWETNNTISNSGGFVPLNTWTHIALVRNGSTITGYVNGSSVGTTTDSGAITPTTHSLIGSYRGSILFANGYISNARVTKAAVYTSNFTPSTTPLAAIANTSLLTCQSNRFIDNSTNAYTITPSGTAAVSSAQPFTLPTTVATYGSGYFDGTGDYLSVPNTTNASGNFTYEFWMYATGFGSGGYGTMVGASSGSASNIFQFQTYSASPNRILGYVGAAAGAGNLSPTLSQPVLNRWIHIAVVRSGSTVTMYENGVSVATLTMANTINFGSTMQIGADGSASYPFQGYLTDSRLVIGTAVYTSNFTPPTTPLTAITNTTVLTTQYNGAGNNSGFKDSSLNNFVVSRFGNTTQGTFSPYGSNWSNYFDGTTDYLTAPANAAFGFGTGDFTAECWVYPVSWVGLYDGFISTLNSGTAVGIHLSRDGVEVNGVATAWGTTLSLNTWTHLALTRSGTTLRLFVNGALTNSGTNSANIGSSSAFAVGRRLENVSNYYCNAYISNARIVKGTAVYTSAFTPSTTPLTAISGTSVLTCQSNRFKDNSTNNFTITRNGDVSVQRFSPFAPTSSYSTSVIGGSGYFDGNGDYLTSPSSSSLAFGTGDFTVEEWFYPTTTQPAFCRYFGTGPNSGDFTLDQQGSGLTPTVNDNNTVFITSSIPLVLNAWNHLAVTRSGTTLRMFVNGASAGSATNSTNFTSNVATYIGKNSGSAVYNTGYFSDVRAIKGTALYTSAFTPPTAPLTATSNTALLLSFTNAAIYDNSMMNDLETVGNAMVSTRVKKYGAGSMYFDGSADYLDSTGGAVNALGSGNWTIEFWVYFNALTGTNIIDYRSASVLSNTLAVNYSSGMQLYVNNTTTAIQGSALSTGTWYHIAVCKSGSSTKMFVNGTQAGSTYTDSNNYVAGVNRPRIGSGGDVAGNYFNGYIDDLRITKGVARYTTTFTPPTSQLPDQ